MNSAASRGIRWSVPEAGLLLLAATIAAYHNRFSVPFVFDDPLSITENPTIRQLWPLSGPCKKIYYYEMTPRLRPAP